MWRLPYIYIRENINFIQCEELTSTYNTETIWCSIITDTGSLLLGDCYHSKSVDLESELALHELLRTACTTCDSVVIVGDFNHRTIDRQAGRSQGKMIHRPHTRDLFLTQHVHNAIRGDLVFSSEPNMVDNIRIREPFSDHNIVICDFTH